MGSLVSSAMLSGGSALLTLGVAIILHAAFTIMKYRAELKALDLQFERAPWSVTHQDIYRCRSLRSSGDHRVLCGDGAVCTRDRHVQCQVTANLRKDGMCGETAGQNSGGHFLHELQSQSPWSRYLAKWRSMSPWHHRQICAESVATAYYFLLSYSTCRQG